MKKELGYGKRREYMPVVTDDEGRPMNVDVYISDKIYTEEEMVKLFRESSNPRRQKRSEMTFFPPLTGVDADGYFIAFDRGNRFGGKDLPVGRVGWKYLDEHKLYLTAGIQVIDMYRGMGLAKDLWSKRDSSVFGNKPAIGMASNFQQGWLDFIQREGWTVDPPVESLPESIQDEVRDTIEGDKPRRLISKNIDMAMKKAWEILKADTRPDIRNEAQYNAASLEERKSWHSRQFGAYSRRLKVLRNQYTVDLTDVENPVYQEMKQYQEIRNFHDRQYRRIVRCINRGQSECNDYYSMELEGNNRNKQKLLTTPTGKADPYVELSLEVYNNLTPIQKRRYHDGMKTSLKGKNDEESSFHSRMYSRLLQDNNPQTFPSSKYGGESRYEKHREISREEYLNLEDDEKRKYHKRMSRRQDTAFHHRMYDRLSRQSDLPNYYSPEHEQEEQ